MTTDEIIALMRTADPSGKKEIIVEHEGYGYAVSSPTVGSCDNDGIIADEDDDDNKRDCLIININT